MNKFLYYLIQSTYGIITFVPGLLVTLVLKIFGCKTYENGYGFITTVGGNWGGLSLGPFAFCGRYNDESSPAYNMYWYEHTRYHEFGHSIQVLFMGPLYYFIVAIPSAIRYWYQRLTPNKKHKPYDSIWIEGFATRKGTEWIDHIEN